MSVKKKATPLDGIVSKIIKDLKKKEKEHLDIYKLWRKTVDKKIVKHTKPTFFKRHRLVVNVSDSSRLYKLTLEKTELIKKLNREIKTKQKIKEIQFRIGDTTQVKEGDYGEEKT